jgi:aspartate kinase
MAPGLASGIKAVVHEHDIARITITSPAESFEGVAAYLDMNNIQVRETHFRKKDSDSVFTFILSLKNLYNSDTVIRGLKERFPGNILIEDGLGALSLIGDGLNDNTAALPETLGMLRVENIEVLGVTTTSFRISLLVNNTDLEKGTHLCHRKWIKS